MKIIMPAMGLISTWVLILGCGNHGSNPFVGGEPSPSRTQTIVDVSQADVVFVGEGSNLVANLGDVNGDGYDDVVIGEDSLFFGPLDNDFYKLDVADLKLPIDRIQGSSDCQPQFYKEINGLTGYKELVIGTQMYVGPITEDYDFSEPDIEITSTFTALAYAGDVNGDGLADLLVRSYHSITDDRGVSLVFGPITEDREVVFGEADVNFIPEDLEYDMGVTSEWASVGDVNGDGLDDILIGAPNANGAAGKAYLFYGPLEKGYINVTDADAIFLGEYSTEWGNGDNAGDPISSVGDVNGDGYDDILIGSMHAHDDRGAVYLINGPVSGTVSLSNANAKMVGENDEHLSFSSAGRSITEVGDVNGDGFDDILIGALDVYESDSGAVYLVFGPVEGAFDLSWADVKFVAEELGVSLGSAIGSAGDLNKDGYADILIGGFCTYCGPCLGKAYLFYGGPNFPRV